MEPQLEELLTKIEKSIRIAKLELEIVITVLAALILWRVW
jgi:hypothetical protein